MSTRQACATGGQTERDRWFRDQTPPERTQPMKELDEIEARWARVRDHNDAGSPEYTELVDASVLDVPSLVAALRAVLELHVSDGESQGYTPDGYRVIPSACSQCGTPGEYGVPWPCATVRAIESALTPLGEAYAYAQTHALLAIAEQLRVSNLIALAESESPTLGEPAYRATEALARWIRTTNEGVDSDHWALRPNIAAALGIEAAS